MTSVVVGGSGGGGFLCLFILFCFETRSYSVVLVKTPVTFLKN